MPALSEPNALANALIFACALALTLFVSTLQALKTLNEQIREDENAILLRLGNLHQDVIQHANVVSTQLSEQRKQLESLEAGDKESKFELAQIRTTLAQIEHLATPITPFFQRLRARLIRLEKSLEEPNEINEVVDTFMHFTDQIAGQMTGMREELERLVQGVKHEQMVPFTEPSRAIMARLDGVVDALYNIPANFNDAVADQKRGLLSSFTTWGDDQDLKPALVAIQQAIYQLRRTVLRLSSSLDTLPAQSNNNDSQRDSASGDSERSLGETILEKVGISPSRMSRPSSTSTSSSDSFHCITAGEHDRARKMAAQRFNGLGEGAFENPRKAPLPPAGVVPFSQREPQAATAPDISPSVLSRCLSKVPSSLRCKPSLKFEKSQIGKPIKDSFAPEMSSPSQSSLPSTPYQSLLKTRSGASSSTSSASDLGRVESGQKSPHLAKRKQSKPKASREGNGKQELRALKQRLRANLSSLGLREQAAEEANTLSQQPSSQVISIPIHPRSAPVTHTQPVIQPRRSAHDLMQLQGVQLAYSMLTGEQMPQEEIDTGAREEDKGERKAKDAVGKHSESA